MESWYRVCLQSDVPRLLGLSYVTLNAPLLSTSLSISQEIKPRTQKHPYCIPRWALTAQNLTTNSHLQKEGPDYVMSLHWNWEWHMRWKSINKYYYKFSYFFPKTSKQKIIFSLILERMARDYFLMKRGIFLAKDDIQNTSSRCHSRHSLPMPKWSLSIPFNKSLLPSLIFSQYI